MSVTFGPRLGLMLNAAAGDAHPNEFRAFLRGMDALSQISAKSRTTAAQPSSPTNGDTYILPSGATGTAWGGKAAGTIAYYTTQQTTTSGGTENTASGWDFITPNRGFYANVEDEGDALYNYDGSAWQVFYKVGTWTPVATNLGGTVTLFEAKWFRVGMRSDFTIRISGASLTAVANSTTLTMPLSISRYGACMACNSFTVANYGVGLVSSTGRLWLPTIPATSDIIVSGVMFHS